MAHNSIKQAPVSVIIPVYNRFDFLDATLASVFAQTVTPAEVLLVDDCSTVSIEEYVAGTAFKQRVNVLKTDRNRGVAGARNWGWRHSIGDFVAFDDSDDIWVPEKLAFQLDYLERNPSADGIYTALIAFYPDGSEVPWAHDRPERITVESALADANLCVQSFLVKRSVLEEIGGFDESFRILDDQDIAIRLALHGAEIHFVANPALTKLRRNSQNYSSNGIPYFKDDLRIIRKYRQLCDEIYGPGSHRVHLGRAIFRLGSQVRYTGRLSRLVSSALCASAPRSRMPRPNL